MIHVDLIATHARSRDASLPPRDAARPEARFGGRDTAGQAAPQRPGQLGPSRPPFWPGPCSGRFPRRRPSSRELARPLPPNRALAKPRVYVTSLRTCSALRAENFGRARRRTAASRQALRAPDRRRAPSSRSLATLAAHSHAGAFGGHFAPRCPPRKDPLCDSALGFSAHCRAFYGVL